MYLYSGLLHPAVQTIGLFQRTSWRELGKTEQQTLNQRYFTLPAHEQVKKVEGVEKTNRP